MSLTPIFGGGVFPLGTHVYREPHQDQEELLADLPILKRLGFNMIKIQEVWATDEPREGAIDFARIERVIARAGELGLGVYLGLTMEEAPAWMWRKFPDCRLVYANGLPHNDPTQYCLPADGKPGPCWDHPGARAAGERFVAALARQLGRFEHIWTWNTWQEIGFWPNSGGALGFCYCEHTLAAFRTWLHARYGTLRDLNATWQSAYGDWAEVEPPRVATFNPPFVDWRTFMDDVYLTRALEWKTRALKANDPAGRPVFSHVAGPTIGAGGEWRWARAGDFFGTSNYPAWNSLHAWDDGADAPRAQHACELIEIWNGLMLRGDLVRSATGRDRAFWAAEFQGGPVSTHLHMGRVPGARDIRRWMLAGLAAGMHGISFWNHRVEISWQECNGFGLLDAQGETSERIEEAARIGRALNEQPAIFAQGQPPKAEVALLVNQALWHFCQGTQNQASEVFSYNMRGHYARLWRLGIPIDFIDADEVANGALDGYKAAILPMPLALDGAYLAHLRAFVEAGGTLISDACPGRFDRYGFCPREQMVAGGQDLFGARHGRVSIVREPGGASRWTPAERTWGEFAPPTVLEGSGDYAGQALRAGFYLQTLLPTSGSPILHAGADVAGVINRVGAGAAVLLGTFAGLCATAHVHPAADQLWGKLLRDAGVTPDRAGGLLRRRRVLYAQQAWFLINPAAEERVEIIALEGFREARDLLGDTIIGHTNDTVTVRVSAASIGCVIVETT